MALRLFPKTCILSASLRRCTVGQPCLCFITASPHTGSQCCLCVATVWESGPASHRISCGNSVQETYRKSSAKWQVEESVLEYPVLQRAGNQAGTQLWLGNPPGASKWSEDNNHLLSWRDANTNFATWEVLLQLNFVCTDTQIKDKLPKSLMKWTACIQESWGRARDVVQKEFCLSFRNSIWQYSLGTFYIKRTWFSITVFPKTCDLSSIQHWLLLCLHPAFKKKKYSWFLVLLITCKFDFSWRMVNTNVEITPGHILQCYTCATDSRVPAPNPRKQFFPFSASANTAAVPEILACIAINVPAVLG